MKIKPSPDQIKHFREIQTPREIASILGIKYENLVYNIYTRPISKRYTLFQIPKRKGGVREICAPIDSLKYTQRILANYLIEIYKPKSVVHGFCNERNIITNAYPHKKKRFVFSIDLENFFPTINFGRVRGMFMAYPFNFQPQIATVLAQICCHSNQLPQGAPTSPIISNLLCAKMDGQIRALAQNAGCTYTRYADDLTFSTSLSIFSDQIVNCGHRWKNAELPPV